MNSPILNYRNPATSRGEAGQPQIRNSIFWTALVLVAGVFLSVILVPYFSRPQSGSYTTPVVGDLSQLRTALQAFNIDNDRYPTTSEGLQTLVQNPGNLPRWKGYMESIPVDPWGTPYVYQCPGTNGRAFDLFSAGPDKKVGTADDIDLSRI